MDFWDLTRLLFRRWYIAVPMSLASVVLVVLASRIVSPDYKAIGRLQMIPAPSTGRERLPNEKPQPVNPWLDLGYGALGNAAAVTVTDVRALERLQREGFSDNVTVTIDNNTVLIEIEVNATSPEQATATVRRVMELVQQDIAVKQRKYHALPEDTISTLVLSDGSATEVVTSKVKRVLIVAAGLGLLLTIASTIAFDAWLRRRSRRRVAGAAMTALEPGTVAGGDDEQSSLERRASSNETQVLREPVADGVSLARPLVGVHPKGLPVTVDYRHPENEEQPTRPVSGVPTSGVPTDGANDASDATIVLPAFQPFRRQQPQKKR